MGGQVWFMSGSGGCVREKVGEGRYRSRSARTGRAARTPHPTKWQRGADLKKVVREGKAAGGVWVRGCLESAGLRVVRTKAA